MIRKSPKILNFTTYFYPMYYKKTFLAFPRTNLVIDEIKKGIDKNTY